MHGKLRRAENKLRVRRNKEAAAARRQAAKEAKAAKKQKQKVRPLTSFIAHHPPAPLELWGFESENRELKAPRDGANQDDFERKKAARKLK